MKDLKLLSDQILLSQTKEMVRMERETSLKVLELLLEVERRRLFAGLGHSSLYDFCVRGLGFTEAEALRRISSMRLIRNLTTQCPADEGRQEVQKMEEKIKNGDLSLSVLAQAQSFFQQEAKAGHALDVEKQKEVLGSLEGKSTREAARELANRSSDDAPSVNESMRPLKGGYTEIKMVVNRETMVALEKIKGLLSHQHPHLGWGKLIEILAKLALEKLDPAREPKRAQARQKESPVSPTVEPTSEVPKQDKPSIVAAELEKQSGRLAIPAALKRKVWQITDGACTFVDPVSGRRCMSRHFPQVEHMIPVAQGGLTEISNLTLHCFYHNQYRAIQKFGFEFMEPFINDYNGRK